MILHFNEPYVTPFYFLLLTLALVPLVLAHLAGKKWMGYQVALTVVFLWLTFGGTLSLWSLLAFGLWQTVLVLAYLAYRRGPSCRNSTLAFVVSILLSIAPLIGVKLTTVLGPSSPGAFIAFVGISYVTFKAVSTIIEIRDGLVKELPPKDFLYFLYFFPTFASGPIDRFRRFRKELDAPVSPDYQRLLDKGIFYIFMGFLYNFVISLEIHRYLLTRFAAAATTRTTLLNLIGSMYSYGLYLFFNFAGYSFFAIGVSYLMGYKIPVNFNKPFLAKNIHDFWNRWHISLSYWFRDFVYMRFVKFLLVKKTFSSPQVVAGVGYVVNMGLMGCWHGLTPFYIAYGLYHALLMIVYDAWIRFKKKHHLAFANKRLGQAVGVVVTVNAVFVGFLIFSGIPYYAFLHAMGSTAPIPSF